MAEREKSAGMMNPVPGYRITEHALFEMERRGLSQDLIWSAVRKTEQQFEMRPGRTIFQSRVTMGEPGKRYLLRIFVDTDREPAEIVTAYRTSRVQKYWRSES